MAPISSLLLLFCVGISVINSVETLSTMCNSTFLPVALTLFADVDVPLAEGLSPDVTYSVYLDRWRYSPLRVENELREGSMRFFADSFGVEDIRNLRVCGGSIGFLSNPFSRQKNICKKTDLISGITTVYMLNDDEDDTSPLITGQGDDSLVAIMQLFHVITPEIVGYNMVQCTLLPGITCPMPVTDSAFVLDILEDGVFTSPVLKKNDRLLYGWYTIANVEADRPYTIIHYESLVPFDKTAALVPLSWRLYHDKWGYGVSAGVLSQPSVSISASLESTEFEEVAPLLPPGFEVKITAWRNLLNFPPPFCRGTTYHAYD
eukprot:TRINITY_DN7408_c0_g1_i1.p1 TRINITY_DN7408_c0_g1~~TRINITY_DN7408_c0_g1_i1.p1  ORF type:complete len:319 (+),score=15.70 TRINITY_DN7408_c0_g1_i1:105-1061(+)